MTTSRLGLFTIEVPLDIIQKICLNLNLKNLITCSSISKIWNQFTQYDSLWRKLCERDFCLSLQAYAIGQNTIYRKLYKYFYTTIDISFSEINKDKMPTYLINLEPITLKGLKTHNLQIACIYTGKNGTVPSYIPIEEMQKGSEIKNLYKKVSKQPQPIKKWVGKIGNPNGVLRNDPNSIRTRSKIEMGIDCMREKLASDLYQELGRGLFRVPKTRISLQSVLNDFTQWNQLAVYRVHHQKIADCLRIMSRFIEGYHDLSEAQTLHQGVPVSFIEYLKLHQAPPQTLLTPTGFPVPLEGFMSLLAVARILSDADVLGGGGGNAGFIWVKDDKGMVAGAQVVKIDPGYCFSFGENQSNWVTGTQKGLYAPGDYISELRDLQTSTLNRDTVVRWKCLNSSQQQEFLATFLNSTRYLKSEPVFQFLFHREGLFNRSNLEQMPTYFLEETQTQLKIWVTNQQAIYAEDLKQFKQQHPEQLLRIHYLDNWGELSLPMAEETFPIRELYTSLKIVKEKSQEKFTDTGKEGLLPETTIFETASSDRDQLEMDTSLDSWMSLQAGAKEVTLSEFFQPHEGQVPRKVLITGRAGIGKSTLCQKMAHDWASGKLWSQEFESVYWIPLRLLNHKEWEFKDFNRFLAEIVSNLILKNEVEMGVLLEHIQQHRQKSLWILDGYDEASPQLQTLVAQLLQEKDLTVVLTSRPGMAEALQGCIDLRVENVGFSEVHIQAYAEQFFSRKAVKNDHHSFLKMLRKHQNLFEIAHIPLQLQMLCSLWEQKKEEFTSHLTGLYQQMVEQLLKWNSKKLLSCSSHDLLVTLGKIAELGLMSHQLILPKQKIEDILKESKIRLGDLRATGLLKEFADGNFYAFLHLSFQEYLAAYHAAALPLDNLKEFILQHCRRRSSYGMTLAFLCGLLYQRDATQVTLFFATLYESHRRNIDFGLSLLCLNECPDYVEDNPILDQVLAQYLSASKFRSRKKDKLLFSQTNTLKYFYTKRPSLFHEEDDRGGSLFSGSCYFGNSELVKWLISQDPSLASQVSSDNGITTLHLAACKSHLELAKCLVSKNPSLLCQSSADGTAPVHFAIGCGHLEMVKWLVSQDIALLHQVTNDGSTVLHFAVKYGHLEIIKWLISQDITLLCQIDDHGRTPLHLATHDYGDRESSFHLPRPFLDLEIVKWFVSQDITLLRHFDKDGLTPFHRVLECKDLEWAEWIMAQDTTLLRQVDKNGSTPLHLAVRFNHFEMVKWLISQDSTLLHQVTYDGSTPLHLAVQCNFTIFRSIVSKDATSLHQTTDDGLYKLFLPVSEMIEWLVSQDVNLLRQVTNDGSTLLHVAVRFNQFQILKWLVHQEHSLLNKINNIGWTPLHVAAANGHLGMTRWLVSQDAKQAIARTKTGRTPYQLALQNGHPAITSWLETYYPEGCKERKFCIIS